MTQQLVAARPLPVGWIHLANDAGEYEAGTAVAGEVELVPPIGETAGIGRVWLELSVVCASPKSPTQRELVSRIHLFDAATILEATRWPFEVQLRYFPVTWIGRPFTVTWQLTLHTITDAGRELARVNVDVRAARLPDAPQRAAMPPYSAYRETARPVSRILSGERTREALHDHLLGASPQTEIVVMRDSWEASPKRPEASDFGRKKPGAIHVTLTSAWLGLVGDHLELWCALHNTSKRNTDVDAIEWTIECKAINRFTRRGSVVFSREGAIDTDGMFLRPGQRRRIRFAVSLPADVPGTLHKRYYEIEWEASVTVLTDDPVYEETDLFVLPLRPPVR